MSTASRIRTAPAGRNEAYVRTQLQQARQRVRMLDTTASLLGWAILTLAYSLGMVIADRTWELPAMARQMAKPGPEQQVAYYLARDADDSPLAFARVALLGEFAVLFTMLSHPDKRPSASWARYQLHTFLALDLGRSGVKHLLIGSALRETVGNQYFQHLLGYRVRNLRIKVIESGGT